MKRLNIFLGLLALVLVLTSGIGSAWAYFTTYAEAKGGYQIQLGEETRIREDFSAWTKHVRISSAEGSLPVFVRAIAYCDSPYEIEYIAPNGNWTPGEGGYYYYNVPIAGGEETDELQVKIDNVPVTVTDGETFNVIVYYESTFAKYNEDGTAYADWNEILDSYPVEGGD